MCLQAFNKYSASCEFVKTQYYIYRVVFLCVCVESYWGSIIWKQWPEPPSRTSWRGGDVWSSRENRISPYHCCLNTQLVRRETCTSKNTSTGPSQINSVTCRTIFSSAASFLSVSPGDVTKHVSSLSASTASLQEVKSVRQEVICLDSGSTGISEDNSKTKVITSAITENTHKTGETHTHSESKRLSELWQWSKFVLEQLRSPTFLEEVASVLPTAFFIYSEFKT